jgi:uncharacterized protein YbjQ (UPF0145 family)
MSNSKKILILTTGHYDLNKYEPIGLINANVAHGLSLFRGAVSGFTSIFGGSQSIISEKYDEMQRELYNQVYLKANAMGADLVVGLDVDQTILIDQNFIFSAYATALKLKKNNNNKKPHNKIKKN